MTDQLPGPTGVLQEWGTKYRRLLIAAPLFLGVLCVLSAAWVLNMENVPILAVVGLLCVVVLALATLLQDVGVGQAAVVGASASFASWVYNTTALADTGHWLYAALFSAATFFLSLLVLAMTALTFQAMRRNPSASKDDRLDETERRVLYLGLAAGLAAGLLVLSDFTKRHDGEGVQSVDVQRLVSEALGPASLTGVMVAVLVAVGSIVFVFEKRIALFMHTANALVDDLSQIRLAVPALGNTLVTMGQVTNHLQHVDDLIAKGDLRLLNAQATYLNTCLSPLKQNPSLRRDILKEITETYWLEEAVDVSRSRLVTNVRNYTAFLAATLEAVERNHTAGLEFLTVTPHPARRLFNWHTSVVNRDGTREEGHGHSDFIAAYMLVISEVVRRGRITHKRWSMLVPGEANSGASTIDVDSELTVIGVPVPVGDLQPWGRPLIPCCTDRKVGRVVFPMWPKDSPPPLPYGSANWDAFIKGKEALWLAAAQKDAGQLANELAVVETPFTGDKTYAEDKEFLNAVASGKAAQFASKPLLFFPTLQRLHATLCRNQLDDAPLEGLETSLARLSWVELWRQGVVEGEDLKTWFTKRFHSRAGRLTGTEQQLKAALGGATDLVKEEFALIVKRDSSGVEPIMAMQAELPLGYRFAEIEIVTDQEKLKVFRDVANRLGLL